MSPRNRSKKNKGLEPNLYARAKGKAVYYEYQRPDTGKTFGMGTNKAEAVDAARQLNSRLMHGQSLVQKVTGKASIESIADRYLEAEIEKNPDIKESTKSNYRNQIKRIKKDLGSLAVSTIETVHIAEFLDQLAGDSYRNHRRMLHAVMDFAISKGLIAHNPVTATQARLKGVKKSRKRLTTNDYGAIREAAPEWFMVAMDIALLLCLGRNEVAKMKFADEEDGALLIERQKVERYETSRIAAQITPALREVLNRAKALPPLSQNVVSKPRYKGQLNPEMLTREFRKLATATKIFSSMPTEEWPSFHEIRSLGSHLIKSVEKRETGSIQILMTHSSEKQTKEYLAGHKEKQYAPAQAGNTILW